MTENNTIDASEQTGILPTAEVKEADITTQESKVETPRQYTRDEVNKIAAKAKQDAVASILKDLQVESLEQVKSVVKSLQQSSTEGGNTLNIESLKDAVKKKEQTVEDLQRELKQVKQDMVWNQHKANLYSNMPAGWTESQRDAILKVMKADDMIQVEGDTFALRNGESYFTIDGEKPDYKSAIDYVGKQLGYAFGKQGVEIPNMEKGPNIDRSSKVFDPNTTEDRALRRAYVELRSRNTMVKPTEYQVKEYAKTMTHNIGIGLQGNEALRTPSSAKK